MRQQLTAQEEAAAQLAQAKEAAEAAAAQMRQQLAAAQAQAAAAQAEAAKAKEEAEDIEAFKQQLKEVRGLASLPAAARGSCRCTGVYILAHPIPRMPELPACLLSTLSSPCPVLPAGSGGRPAGHLGAAGGAHGAGAAQAQGEPPQLSPAGQPCRHAPFCCRLILRPRAGGISANTDRILPPPPLCCSLLPLPLLPPRLQIIKAEQAANVARRLAKEVQGQEGDAEAALQAQQEAGEALQAQADRASMERTHAQHQLDSAEQKVGAGPGLGLGPTYVYRTPFAALCRCP